MLGLFSSRIFLGRAQLRLAQSSALILTYHRVGIPPRGAMDPFLYVTPERLEAQLATLKLAGFRPGTLDDFAEPGRFIVTFDDGFRSVLQLAQPVLARHGVKAIQFIVADKLGGQNDWDVAKGDVAESLMTDDEIRRWHAAGHEIGSHSLTHPNFKNLSNAAAGHELMASKQTLENRFGVAVRHFCYPYGGRNEGTPGLVRDAGYATACTTQHGVNLAGSDPYRLCRITPLTVGELIRKMLHRLKHR